MGASWHARALFYLVLEVLFNNPNRDAGNNSNFNSACMHALTKPWAKLMHSTTRATAAAFIVDICAVMNLHCGANHAS